MYHPALEELSDAAWAALVFADVPLPKMPPPEIQRNWCGNSGEALASQSCEFYSLVKDAWARFGDLPLRDTRVLDFGCGWGRLARLFMRDLGPGLLHGCDPDPDILEWCRQIPGTFRVSEARPEVLPFDGAFDLVYAFSVFTHLGPRTHEAALAALSRAVRPDGLLVLTVRPQTFLRTPQFRFVCDTAPEELDRAYEAGAFLYGGYKLLPVEGEVSYGETVIPLRYIERHWSDRFELVDQGTLTDVYQVPLVLRRRREPAA